MNKSERIRYEKSRRREMTIIEASDYFDEHDIFESEDVKEVADIRFRLRKRNILGLI